jgi:peptidoglycan/LPS O-acetylase OafA/YrhL
LILLGPVSRGLAYLISPDNYFLSLTNSFGAFDQIAMGCLLYFVVQRSRNYFETRRGIAAGVFLSGIILMFLTYLKTNAYYGLDRIYAPSLLALGLSLMLLGGLTFQIRETKFITLACMPGQLSYGIYLLHATVLFFAWDMLMGSSPWLAFILYATFNSVFGYVLFHFYEKPANYFIRRQFMRLLNAITSRHETVRS